MEKEKKQKITIILLTIIIVMLLALCIYLIFVKKDNSKLYSKIDDTKGNYYVVAGETYSIYSNDYQTNKKTQDSEKITLSYPVINMNTDSVINVNAKIKETFSNIETGFKTMQNNGCICVKINDTYCCDEHVEKPSFKVYEDDKFIIVAIRISFLTYCASGGNIDTIYTISKEDGKVLTNNDIINYFGYNRDTINKDLSKYIQSLFEIDISDELKDIPNNLILTINNGKLILGYDVIDGTEYYSYDGVSFKEEKNLFSF